MIDFPASPSIGQTFTSGAQSWTWDGIAWSLTGSDDEPGFLPRTGGTMTGLLQALAGVEVVGPFTAQGGTFTQPLTVATPTAAAHAATKAYADGLAAARYTKTEADGRYLQLTGGAVTGALSVSGQLTLSNNPTQDAHAARKAYVDTQVATRLTQAQGDARYVGLNKSETIGGAKTFNSSPTVLPNNRLTMPHDAGPTKELQYTGSVVGIYDRTNLRWDLQIDANGNLLPRGTMDASNLSGLISIDRIPDTVVKTSGEQSISGRKAFNDHVTLIAPTSAHNPELWFKQFDGKNGAVIWPSRTDDRTTLRAYTLDGSSYKNFQFDGGTGDFSATSFSGRGTDLTHLTASNLANGTVPNARMNGDYSWANLDLTGRLKVTGADGYHIPGLHIEGTIPSIYLRQTDGAAGAILGVNGSNFYVLADDNGDGSYDSIAFQVGLDGSGVVYNGSHMVRAIAAGNGLNRSGGNGEYTLTLGTPGSITYTSTNSVSSSSHTHDLPEAEFQKMLAGYITAGGIGSISLMRQTTGSSRSPNQTIAGSQLRYASGDGDQAAATPAGTWQCLGNTYMAGGAASQTSLFQRIA